MIKNALRLAAFAAGGALLAEGRSQDESSANDESRR